MSEFRELVLGPGPGNLKALNTGGDFQWKNPTTIDINPNNRPDVEWDLSRPGPLPFADDTFDEIHAYEVLEHLGAQGDYATFFRQFSDYWRILKPDGHLMASVPDVRSEWLWGDPGHRRVITQGTLVFLSQAEYAKQVGVTRMCDYRYLYRADFEAVKLFSDRSSFWFILQAVKPSRIRI